MVMRPDALRARVIHGRVSPQAFMEFALLLPVFVLTVMGTIQVALLAMVWINLQTVVQDTTRWMTTSSPAPLFNAGCTVGTVPDPNWPRPHWAIGNDGTRYRDCTLPPLLVAGTFPTGGWTWNPACPTGADCYAAGLRQPGNPLTLTAQYNWSNVLILPVISGGGILSPWIPATTVTATATEVMQY